MCPRLSPQTGVNLVTTHGLSRRLGLVVVSAILVLNTTEAHAQLTIDVPPDPAPTSIDSNTTLNLHPTGTLAPGFNAGAFDNTSTNVVVNIEGGSTLGQFSARGGSTLNVSSGSMGIFVDIYSGSTANLSGGTIRGLINAFSGSRVNISGGSLGDVFSAQASSSLTVLGGEFRLDGVLVNGLADIGNSVALDIPVDSVLSATLQDGTPLAFTSQDIDLFAAGTLALEARPLPALGPTNITASTDPVPPGIRQGQTLQVDAGGMVGNHFGAGWGSVVNVTGGTVGINMEAVGSTVIIASGIVGDDFDANFDSLVTIQGGSVGDDFDVNRGGRVNLRGGIVGNDFDANKGGKVEISGGSVGNRFGANSGSDVNLIGTNFLLDGIELTSLPLGVRQVISTRGGAELSGSLADGSPFSFDLNSTAVGSEDFFASDAILTITRITTSSADVDNDADVDGADFLAIQRDDVELISAWEAQYGSNVDDVSSVSTTQSSPTVVPEPASLLLWLAAFSCTIAPRRTRSLKLVPRRNV